MSALLRTSDNKPIKLMSFDMVSGESTPAIVIRVIATDAQLLSEASGDVQIKAREHGSGDPYVDLATSPIDLSGYTPGDAIDFDLIVTAGTVTGLQRIPLFCGVVKSGPAAWAA